MVTKRDRCDRPLHKDVEFAVDVGGEEKIFYSFKEAAEAALQEAISHGETVNLDVLVYSAEGAKAWQGDDGAEQYEEDEEASVFERFEVSVNAVGRVP